MEFKRHLPERELLTGLSPISIQQPRVRDKRAMTGQEDFASRILPKYLRKTRALEELITWLYLKEICINDFPEALQALLCQEAKGLTTSRPPTGATSARQIPLKAPLGRSACDTKSPAAAARPKPL
ncbi:MAG: hypothetical protein R3C12_21110 [Planctomycetaceae bacterium]